MTLKEGMVAYVEALNGGDWYRRRPKWANSIWFDRIGAVAEPIDLT